MNYGTVLKLNSTVKTAKNKYRGTKIGSIEYRQQTFAVYMNFHVCIMY